ncbi:thymidine phosphorylase DeoA [Candidatus Malacoplasma girerdii]|uniref:Thymidine phosphorylase DeoA n=1 Tax=Candidatus Malacoplasma girerdii TaxID=1318617 RepID=A0A097STJ2_9BACT|nr:thymidine phosphorylase DeoA [Candidatus Malacoplasma girerdii]
MDILEILQKKRLKQKLSQKEIEYFINEYTHGKEITDYQASALLMAICINGMDDDEAYYLTKAMLESGKTIDFPNISGIKIDKHSTGGVGDKVSLILSPICVALGIKVAKMSGPGLGFTGGTTDKLASIGVNTALQGNEYLKILKENGMFIMRQTADLVPADKLLYDLRSATNTFQSLALVAASVCSKKLALNTDCIFIDLKMGSGAVCETLDMATKLAQLMCKIFKRFNRKASILITNMDQPLGCAVGNAIEVKAAMDFLNNKPENKIIRDFIYDLVIDVLLLTKKAKNKAEATKQIDQVIANKTALEIFKKWVIAQGAKSKVVNGNFFLPKYKLSVLSNQSGYIKYKSCKEVGEVAFNLGAGRLHKEDSIDYQAGIWLNKTMNDFVKEKEVIATLYSSKPISKENVKKFLDNVAYSKKPFPKTKMIIKVVQ